MKRYSFLVLFFSAIIVLSGCLTAQYKEYEFEFKDGNSGTLTITHVNIFSQMYDDEDPDSTSLADYNELLDKYIVGEGLEEDYPNAKVRSKRLYEKNGELCGEIIFEFENPEDVNLYQYDKKSPYVFYFAGDETYFNSNGKKPLEKMPVVFWDRKMKKKEKLTLTTSISEFKDADVSLVEVWKSRK